MWYYLFKQITSVVDDKTTPEFSLPLTPTYDYISLISFVVDLKYFGSMGIFCHSVDQHNIKKRARKREKRKERKKNNEEKEKKKRRRYHNPYDQSHISQQIQAESYFFFFRNILDWWLHWIKSDRSPNKNILRYLISLKKENKTNKNIYRRKRRRRKKTYQSPSSSIMMNRYQHQHPQPHNSNATLPSNHHFHLSTSTTTTVLQTPIDTYSTDNNNLQQQNQYNLLDDNYVYHPPPSYCTKHQPIYRSPLDSQSSVYETYTSPTNIPYEQFCIENSQTSPSSWVATTSDGTIYHHPIQSFEQCNIYLNNSQLSEQNYREYSSIPLSNNETSSSSSTSSSSFNNPPPVQYRQLEQSSTDEKPLTIVANEAKYKWMQIKRTPAKTAGKRYVLILIMIKTLCSSWNVFHQIGR